MWRYLAGALAVVMLAAGGLLLVNGRAASDRLLPAMPRQTAGEPAALPDTVPEATARTREEKRFGRYDKDSNGKITREEYLANRRKAYARLDTDHDGTLSFDEWAVKATTKFAGADADHDGAMSPAEFATTAVKRKPKTKCACPPAPAAAAGEEEG
ncbi:MAG: histidine kinase [Sphingomonas sp. 28-66-16]|nr:MAG: histidine kinase [Sphingomonas sp. 28-66-16]